MRSRTAGSTFVPKIPATNVCRPTWSLKKDLTEMFVQALITGRDTDVVVQAQHLNSGDILGPSLP